MEILDHLRDHRHDGEADRRHDEELDPRAQDVPVEQPDHAAARRRSQRQRSPSQSVTSCQSPPRVEPISRLTSRRPTSPSAERMMSGPHMASQGERMPRSASASPAVSPTQKTANTPMAPPMTSPIPPRGNRNATTIPTSANGRHAKAMAHFLCTSTRYRSLWYSASSTREAVLRISLNAESRLGGALDGNVFRTEGVACAVPCASAVLGRMRLRRAPAQAQYPLAGAFCPGAGGGRAGSF